MGVAGKESAHILLVAPSKSVICERREGGREGGRGSLYTYTGFTGLFFS